MFLFFATGWVEFSVGLGKLHENCSLGPHQFSNIVSHEIYWFLQQFMEQSTDLQQETPTAG